MSVVTLIIGIGNEYRGDDRIGLIVARQLKAKELPNTTVIEGNGEGAALIETWKEAERVILIDAVASGAEAGTLHRLDANIQPIPAHFFSYSTHAFSVAEAIELARVLRQLPPYLAIYGIEGKDFSPGVGLSLEVEKAAQEVVQRVVQDVHPTISIVEVGRDWAR
jgi:hydrogenase maturation protease